MGAFYLVDFIFDWLVSSSTAVLKMYSPRMVLITALTVIAIAAPLSIRSLSLLRDEKLASSPIRLQFVVSNALMLAASLAFLRLGWKLGAPSTPLDWWLSMIAGTAFLVTCALYFYLLRTHFRLIYGLVEVVFGIVASWRSTQEFLTTQGKWLQVGASLYLLVRGFANVHDGLPKPKGGPGRTN